MKYLRELTHVLVPISRWHSRRFLCSDDSSRLRDLCGLVSTTFGGLDDLETSLNNIFKASLTPLLVNQVIDSCKDEANTRRLLRFFLWSSKSLKNNLKDEDYNRAIRFFASKKDCTAMEILLSDLRRDGRAMEYQTYSVLAETFVKIGKEDKAMCMFEELKNYKCPQDGAAVSTIVEVLCYHGQVERAKEVLKNHKKKIPKMDFWVSKSLLYGYAEQVNLKEVQRIITEMKHSRISSPDLFCYNTYLRCLCETNLVRKPRNLTRDALDVIMEMRSHGVSPNSASYNILLSCLGRAERVKDCWEVLERMKRTGCHPDWMSYFLVIRGLFSGTKFVKGFKLLDEMSGKNLEPDNSFYNDLISVLCGVERLDLALKVFDRMKQNELEGFAPVYEVLIPKLCSNRDFVKGKELWDEAAALGIEIQCSRDVLVLLKTPVSDPNNEERIKMRKVNSRDVPFTYSLNDAMDYIEKIKEMEKKKEDEKKKRQEERAKKKQAKPIKEKFIDHQKKNHTEKNHRKKKDRVDHWTRKYM